VFSIHSRSGLFNVLLDAGPDSWGEKVILSTHDTVPKNKLEMLLAGSGMGAGALVFSLSRNHCKRKISRNTVGDLSVLLRAKDAILNDEEIPNEAKKAFQYGASMGGARPKTLIDDENTNYLVKFNRQDDLFNVAKVEHASMNLLREANCKVSVTKVKPTPTDHVLMVERFDRIKHRPKCHYMSANTIFNKAKVSEADLSRDYSYGAIAEFIMKYGARPEDAHELFKRMVFNVLIGNTDDHTRNHAFLYDFDQEGWVLSPAYDVLPINNQRQHGIGIGEYGRLGTIDNIMSQCTRFGLKNKKASTIVNDISEIVAEWKQAFVADGVGEGDIRRLDSIINRIK
jgi:serine/threonine-protein kinase HipA